MFFDIWQTLNSRFDEGDLPAHAQLVGYKLLAASTESVSPSSFSLSDRELQSRTQIKSTQTIVDARRRLKNAGLIDFQTHKARATQYQFLVKQDSSKIQTNDKQDSNKRQATGLVPYTVSACEVGEQKEKESSPRTPLKEKEKTERAGAREEEAAAGSQAGLAGALPLTTPDANSIHDVWLSEIGEELRGDDAWELERLASCDWTRTVTAIRITAKKQASNPYAYFKAVYNGVGKPQTPPEAPKVESAKDRLASLLAADAARNAAYH